MTISPTIEAEIRRLYFAEHWKRGTIAAQLGVHPDVVLRVLGRLGPKPGAPRPRASVLIPYLPVVDETLARYPRLRATRLFDRIVAPGYAGSLRTLRRYVRTARPTPKREAFLRLNALPGEQAQVDWAHVGEMPVPGGKRALWAFVMVLPYSRASFVELVFSLDVHSRCRSLVRAAAFFGGNPRQWLFDNAKAVVIERQGEHVRFHPDLLDLAAQMHVEPRLCAPRKPQQKGGVERAIRYFKERFFAARTFHSLAHGNAQALEFIETIAHQRPHPRWPERSVKDAFEEERGRLLALPEPLPTTEVLLPVTADKTAFIRFDTNSYSVPSSYAEASLMLAADDQTLRLVHQDTTIACHARCWGRNQQIEMPEHRAALLAEKRQARALKGRDRLRAEIAGIDSLVERWMSHGRNLGSMVVRTLTLLDLYGAAALTRAVETMNERGTHDPGAMAILCEQERKKAGAGIPSPLAFGAHVRERDVIPHDLGGYDD